jgi:hypothetical protein
MFSAIGKYLARFLSRPRGRGVQSATSGREELAATLKKGDVLLIEGNSRISTVIKYLTQSSWSHAVLFVGDVSGPPQPGEEAKVLLEVDINEGVRVIPLSAYASRHTRICRPVGLSPEDIDKVVGHAVSRLGQRYDLKNIFDLARYLIPNPPIPSRWRRLALSLGSGDPTKAICSSLIAEAFQSVPYPILPEVFLKKSRDANSKDVYKEVLHIRHHSLFAPRDFDVSPYFQIVKPTVEKGFDPGALSWGSAGDDVH